MAESYYSQSPYNYVGNNPVSLTDFMGLSYQSVSDIVQELWDNTPDDGVGIWSSGGGGGGGTYNYFSYERAQAAGLIPSERGGNSYLGRVGRITGGSSSSSENAPISLKADFWRTNLGQNLLTFLGFNIAIVRQGLDVVETWDNTQNGYDYSGNDGYDYDGSDGGDNSDENYYQISNGGKPDWRFLTNGQKAVVILNAMHKANLTDQITLNINNLFTNMPSAVPNGNEIYTLDLNIDNKIIKNVTVILNVWSFDNIIYLGGPTQDRQANRINDIATREVLDWQSTCGLPGITISFPTIYNDFFRHWLYNANRN